MFFSSATSHLREHGLRKIAVDVLTVEKTNERYDFILHDQADSVIAYPHAIVAATPLQLLQVAYRVQPLGLLYQLDQFTHAPE
jgi:hypothetical protein